MSNFDNLYEDTMRGKTSQVNNDDVLTKKRSRIHEFFSNQLTQLLVLILWIVFAFNVVTSIINIVQSFSIPNSSPILNIIITGLGLWLAFLIPYGFHLIHNASKENDSNKYIQGVETLKKYLKITKIILIVAAVLIGLSYLMVIGYAFGQVFMMIIVTGLLFWLIFFIIKIFNDFCCDLLGAYKLQDINWPLANRIRTYFIVILVLYVIFFTIGVIILSNLSNFNPVFAGTIYEGLFVDYKFTFWDFIGPVLVVAEIGFFIYYTKQYDVFSLNANAENKKNLARLEEERKLNKEFNE